MHEFLLFLLPLFLASARPDTGAYSLSSATSVRGTYTVDVEYPNIFLFLGALITGAEPDSVVYEERWTERDSSRYWLGSTMTADGTDVWFTVNADTNAPSFTEFPGEKRQRMVMDAVGVLGRFVAFLADSARTSFSGTFSHEWVPLTVSAYVVGPTPPDVRYIVADATSEEGPYLTGWIVAERRDGVLCYTSIRALFHRSNIEVTMTLRALGIERSYEKRTPR